MAATRFLQGVLFFLCMLSHLEGVAHRSNNLFFQLQPPLSPGESVVQNGQQATQDQTLHVHVGVDSDSRFRTKKGCTNFPGPNTNSSPNPCRLLIQGIYTPVFSKPDTDFLNHRDARRFSAGVGLVVLSLDPYAFRQSGRKGKEPFSWLTLDVLFACVRVDTCYP
jgi:hypothetical protein